MTALPPFELHRPTSLAEAATLLAENENARLLAGGTDLMVNIRHGLERPGVLIDLTEIPDLRDAERQDDGGWRIGAGITLSRLLAYDDLVAAYPALGDAARQVAAATHREMATLGGNLCLDTRCVYYNQSEWWRKANAYCLKHQGERCHVAPSGDRCFAAYSGDMAPALLIHDAEARLVSAEGERWVPLATLFQDDGADHLTLKRTEILAELRLPPADGLWSGYAKHRLRGAIDFPLAGVALGLGAQADKVTDLRLALTGLASCPISLDGLDDFLGASLTNGLVEKVIRRIPKRIQPMESTFLPAGYRRKLAAALTRRLFARATHAVSDAHAS